MLERINQLKQEHTIGTREAFVVAKRETLREEFAVNLNSMLPRGSKPLNARRLEEYAMSYWKHVAWRFQEFMLEWFFNHSDKNINKTFHIDRFLYLDLEKSYVPQRFHLRINYQRFFQHFCDGLDLRQAINKEMRTERFFFIDSLSDVEMSLSDLEAYILNNRLFSLAACNYQPFFSSNDNDFIDPLGLSWRDPQEPKEVMLKSELDKAKGITSGKWGVLCSAASRHNYEKQILLNSDALYERFKNEMILNRLSSQREVAISIALSKSTFSDFLDHTLKEYESNRDSKFDDLQSVKSKAGSDEAIQLAYEEYLKADYYATCLRENLGFLERYLDN